VILIFVDNLAYAEVYGIASELRLGSNLTLVLKILFDLVQALLLLSQKFDESRVIDDTKKVHHACDYKKYDAPAVSHVLARVGSDELLLEDHNCYEQA
jgi:hypothetical protein